MDELGTVGGSFGSMELGSFELGFVELGFMEWVFALFLWSFDFLLLLVLHYYFGFLGICGIQNNYSKSILPIAKLKQG